MYIFKIFVVTFCCFALFLTCSKNQEDTGQNLNPIDKQQLKSDKLLPGSGNWPSFRGNLHLVLPMDKICRTSGIPGMVQTLNGRHLSPGWHILHPSSGKIRYL